MTTSRQPPAPSKARQLPPTRAPTTRRTRLAQLDAVDDNVDRLADDLTQLKVRPTATRATSATSQPAPARRTAASARSGVDKTAERETAQTATASRRPAAATAPKRIPSGSTQSNQNGGTTTKSPTEKAQGAMKALNAALANLAALNKAGCRTVSSGSTSTLPTGTPASSRPGSSASTARSASAARGNAPSVAPSSSSSSLRTSAAHAATKDKVERAAKDASRALAELRQLVREGVLGGKRVDIEKAATGIIANLVEMELYDRALTEIGAMRASLLSWWQTAPHSISAAPSTAPTRPAADFLLQVPASAYLKPPTLTEALAAGPARPTLAEIAPLVETARQYLLACLFRSSVYAPTERVTALLAVVQADEAGGGPLAWRKLVEAHCLQDPAETLEATDKERLVRRIDASLTSMFGSITKGCGAIDGDAEPKGLLYLRLYALELYATTSSLSTGALDKLSAFFDQVRKTLLLFGRSAEKASQSPLQISEGVRAGFERILVALHRKNLLSAEAKATERWRELCDVVVHIARRADDLATIERVAQLGGHAATAALPEAEVDADARATQLTGKVVSALAVFEIWVKTNEDRSVAEQLRRTASLLPTLTRLRCAESNASVQETLKTQTVVRLDKAVDRLRYVLAKKIKNGRRLDQLVRQASGPARTADEIDSLVSATLDRVAAHCEQVLLRLSPGTVKTQLATTTVDSLLVLAHATFVIDDRATHSAALRFLKRALPIVGLLEAGVATIDLNLHYTIRALSSALYNLGGMLYNAGSSATGLPFIQAGCDLASAALDVEEARTILSTSMDALDSLRQLSLGDDESQPEEALEEERQKREAVKDLERLMARRWDLLALTQRALGDKTASYTASIASVLAQPGSLLADLRNQMSKDSLPVVAAAFTDLNVAISRLTRSATFDLLLEPDSIPLSRTPRASSLDLETVGALLELQSLSLRPQVDTEEGRRAALAVAQATATAYPADKVPLRRARSLLETLRLADFSGARDALGNTLDEITDLCRRTDLGEDSGLSRFAPLYLASAHIRLAQAVQQVPAMAASIAGPKIADHARDALTELANLIPARSALGDSVLRSSVFSQPRQATIESTSPQSPPLAVRSRRPVRSAATPARARNANRRPVAASQVLVTPPSAQQAKASLRTSLNRSQRGSSAASRSPASEQACFDQDLRDLLQSFAAMLDLRGETDLHLEFLETMYGLAGLSRSRADDTVVEAEVSLARAQLELGQLGRAGLILARSARTCDSAEDVKATTRVSFWLCSAEYHALLGNHERSAESYEHALALAEGLGDSEDAPGSSRCKIVARTLLIRRASQAAHACSVLQQRKGELGGCLGPALQSMRLATRALHNVTRLAPRPQRGETNAAQVLTSTVGSDVSKLSGPAPIQDRREAATFLAEDHATLYWSLARELISRTLRVAQLHLVRGTPKSADFFAQQAQNLAEDVGAQQDVILALSLRVTVATGWSRDEESERLFQDLSRQSRLAKGRALSEAFAAQAQWHQSRGDPATAYTLFDQAQDALDSLSRTVNPTSYKEEDSPQQGRRASGPSVVHFAQPTPSPTTGGTTATAFADWLLPSLQSRLIRSRVRLLFERKQIEDGRRLLRRLKRVTALEEDKAEELKLLAAVQSKDLVLRCASDPVLGMLPDSVLALPAFGVSAGGPAAAKIGTPRTGPSALNSIKDIEHLLARALSLGASRSEADKLSELSVVSAAMRAMQANVSKGSKRMAGLVAHALDLGTAVTLRREMVDATTARQSRIHRLDDLTWPSPASQVIEPTIVDAQADPVTPPLEIMRERYRLETAEPALTETRVSDLLPPPWTLVTVCLSGDADALLISRQRGGGDAIVLKLPLDRLARREGDEELSLPYHVAAATLRNIIERSNAGTQNAKFVNSPEGRAAWWQERKDLDGQLEALLEGIEDVWLGAFKSVFCDAREHSSEAYAAFKSRIERVLKRSMARAAGDRRAARFKVDDTVLECLAALPADSREEDLEDLFYFMAESFQFSGVPLASDETDVDQVVVDFREALEELHGTKSAPKLRPHPDEHTFLVLDKHLHAFPWESLPCLRGRSADPVQIAIDPTRAAYILNPGGDLKNTQRTFEPWLSEQTETRDWLGIVARTPLEEELRNALASRELVLYFGHGGAEQYVRSQTIRNLPQCAVTMLWGCSSGMLKDQGIYDPTGTPYHYMVGGCPALVANLWDVTDKDIDKVAWSVLRQTQIAEAEDKDVSSMPPLSLAAAVARSREVCHLRYLNGAAPVVYGLPVRFRYAPAATTS